MVQFEKQNRGSALPNRGLSVLGFQGTIFVKAAPMKKKLLLLILLTSIQSLAALQIWKPHGHQHSFVLPISVTPAEFLQKAKSHPELSSYLVNLKVSTHDQVIQVQPHQQDQIFRSLLVANKAKDHNPVPRRVNEFATHLPESVILPLGAAHFLSPKERSQFYQELTEHFKLLVLMGGADVAPELYKQNVTWAKDFHGFRDRLEIELIQYFYKNSDRSIFGVCRGLQITGVALGASLVQDLHQDLGTKLAHNDGAMHTLQLTRNPDHILVHFLKKLKHVLVNSYHHQALNEESLKNTALGVIAKTSDGVVEAAGTEDGRVFLIQSHPEKSSDAKSFFSALKGMIMMKTIKGRSCSRAIGL